ncbi:MAG: hypothetical protein KME11_19220 [Timaviella obliquedivisa GSE-PSE-MK23-08B]|jgi:hypothetical protein|nr:hypothetical protein [Timaviella obliquedivisa GSE-PSE-MK23-08B]
MQILLRVGLTLFLLLWSKASEANSSQRIPGNYVCLNNPAPECRNPERRVTPTFACINSSNPECHNPLRPKIELEPRAWSCQMNQNVNCNNTIRYSVEDRESWVEYFEPRLDETTVEF